MNYDNTSVDSSAFVFPTIVGGLFGILAIVALWKIFTKAGKPGWAAIIPFYNIYTMLKVAGRPGWWLILYIIPIVNIIISIVVAIDLAKSFGKSGVFGFFGLWMFSIIGYLMLAFGNANYHGPAAARA
ncbi:DUF5684 domain-containing protein [Umezawaea tangerina]|uniref:Signal peptidase I n=1 Tax=Umezawaea tangerina TaxID=84725 RepID=A0A2T0TE25_9PSEU|nr:DUF5684 domain-containing protein [Umezawaea tangerina]PRY43901.1 hypothetical protein CLV43_103650 [Umezawaea tangerina]